jgi:hypothetical protein
MSAQVPTYSFLPWLRNGVANNITQADGDTGVLVRATLPLDLTLSGRKLDGSEANPPGVHRDISLYGPGDVIGVEARAHIKVEPRDWITNFAPNHLPYVEFYEEDLPWRYTPARADAGAHRLRPWMALMVLAADEFDDGQDMRGKPLQYVELRAGVDSVSLMPPATELWAWAHVHVNLDLSANGDASIPGVLQRLEQNLHADPDRAYSRIVAPRRLEPDKDYHAFLIPTFETGRLAGLGEPVPDTTIATRSAWADHQSRFPYYLRWRFRTSTLGDFEYLVRLLKPRPVDHRVGVRDMDVLHPGPGLPPINMPAELGGVLKLGGALRVPFGTLPVPEQQEFVKYDQWDVPFPHPFETAIARRVNLAADYADAAPSAANPDGDPDPVITSPLYGRWHALTDRVLEGPAPAHAPLPDLQNWVHRLNLDPRFRVAAGFGTDVIQENDDRYMNAAWQQIGDVLTANALIKFAQMAQAVSASWHIRHIESLADARAFLLTAPLHPRVVSDGLTVAAHVSESIVPPVLVSPEFRKIARPGTSLAKWLALEPTAAAAVLTGVNDGTLQPAPPKEPPTGAIGIDDAAGALTPTDEPPWVKPLLDDNPWLRFLPLVLLVLLLILAVVLAVAGLWPVAIALVVIGVPLLLALYRLLTRWAKAGAAAGSLSEAGQTPGATAGWPHVPNFEISTPAAPITPQGGTTDSPVGKRFKDALEDVFIYVSIEFPDPVRKPLALGPLATATVQAIDPTVTIPGRVNGRIKLPGWLVADLVEQFTPAMAYPVIDTPMYKPLADISEELFLPNLNMIPPNSMTLLETNQRFIEAYMAGLNHEFARELLWGEFPTDQRCSSFRQFWDVNMQLPPAPTPAQREAVRDIPPLHLWSRHSELGHHNQREAHGQTALLVLVIRGELLKRYPTAVIYARKARWHRRANGSIDVNAERELVDLTDAEEESLPPGKILKPLFEAKVDPDIYFIGFDLDAKIAKGGTTASEDAGWFFVIKERPGEPRFGLDESPDGGTPRLINWNDLAWQHLGTAPGGAIHLDQTLAFTPYNAALDQEDKPDPEDAQAGWSPGTNAADLAYILYRVPVLVAVHASRML